MGDKPKRTRAKKTVAVVAADSLTADQVEVKPVKWLVQPWITRSELSLIVGNPNVGKSTFVAWLLRFAENPVVFPGREESLSSKTIPRWKEAGVKLDRVRVLFDRDYRFPRDGAEIIRRCTEWGCDLIILDPIDSYYSDSISEIDGQAVREFLESLAMVADKTGAAVVGIRHPGKDPRNLLPGSRQWRAVPRTILQLAPHDDEAETYVCSFIRDSNGGGSLPWSYTLEQAHATVPRVFRWGKEVSREADKLTRSSESPTDRLKVVEACQLIYHLFTHGDDPTVQDFIRQCQALGIGERSRVHAQHLLGIRSRPADMGGAWVLIRHNPTWPDWLLQVSKNGNGVSHK